MVWAQRIIEKYNDDIRYWAFSIEQSKPVAEYIFQKVWIILSGSGIFMLYDIHKRKDRVKVEICLSEQDKEFIDDADCDSDGSGEAA